MLKQIETHHLPLIFCFVIALLLSGGNAIACADHEQPAAGPSGGLISSPVSKAKGTGNGSPRLVQGKRAVSSAFSNSSSFFGSIGSSSGAQAPTRRQGRGARSINDSGITSIGR